MTLTEFADRIDCSEASAAAWLARATHELDRIIRSLDTFLADAGRTASASSVRDELREHSRSLRRRLPLVTRDPQLAVRLQAELSQLEWASRVCLRQIRIAVQVAEVRPPEVRAS